MNAAPPRRFYFNGVNGRTGQYLQPPLESRDVARRARGLRLEPALKEELIKKAGRRKRAHLGVGAGIDSSDLASAGWGAVFADDAEPEIYAALQPLLEHRARQAGRLYREYAADKGQRSGESKNAFLTRHGIGPGPVVPSIVPYYLLLVGSPERIPFRFQYELDVAYAVGRVSFQTPEEYARYARNVVRAETEPARAAVHSAAFFGVRNCDDPATQLSADLLVAPLGELVAQEHPSWRVETVLADHATKRRLKDVMGGPATPRLLFTASHGMGFQSGDELQATDQGALLCQDWPGPREHEGPIPSQYYLSGRDIADDADLSGCITFHFACFGAGTPRLDDFPEADVPPDGLAPQAFVAPLAQRLLAHANGSLAMVGHVDRAWGFSFLWDNAAVVHREAFRSALSYLLDGRPVGSAIEFFNQRYAEITSLLANQLNEYRFRTPTPDEELALADLWLANNDARNLVILGDPAVRLRV